LDVTLVPLTVNIVDDPGTTIDTHPPLPVVTESELNMLSSSVNDDVAALAMLDRMLNAPPDPPATPLLNAELEIAVAIPSYVTDCSDTDPPLDAPALQFVNMLDMIPNDDVENEAS